MLSTSEVDLGNTPTLPQSGPLCDLIRSLFQITQVQLNALPRQNYVYLQYCCAFPSRVNIVGSSPEK